MGIYVIVKKTEVIKKLGIKSASEEHLKWCGLDRSRIWYEKELNELFDKHSEELMEHFEHITGENLAKYLISTMPRGRALSPEEAIEYLLEEVRRGPQP